MQLDLNNTEILNISQNGSFFNYTVNNNQRYALKLKSNPTTGFNWYLLNSEQVKQTNLLEFLNLDENGCGEYVSDPSLFRFVGVGGYNYILFHTNENTKGIVQLQLVYARIWEKNNFSKKISLFLNVGN